MASNSAWYKTVGTLVGGIILYTLAGIVGDIVDIIDSASSMSDMMDMFSGRGSRGMSETDIVGWICDGLVIVGYILFLNAIAGFTKVQPTPADTENAIRIKQSYIYLIIATLIGLIPVVGSFIALIFLIISYVKQIKGYKGLSQSHAWTPVARQAASTLRAVVIWTLVAAILGVIPIVGDIIESIITFILFFVMLSAWIRIRDNAPTSEVVMDEACKIESQIRQDAEGLCEEENQRRVEEEKARLEREEIKRKEAAERRKAFWQKWRVLIILSAIALIAVAFVCWWTSDTHRFNQGIACVEQFDYDKAIEYFTKVSNENSKHYSEAKYRLGDIYFSRQDSAKAAEAYIQSVSTGKWEYYDGYRKVAFLYALGDMAPYIPKDYSKAAELFENSPEYELQALAGIIYHDLGKYEEAYPILQKTYNLVANNRDGVLARLGMMCLYGRGVEANARSAQAYLKSVDDYEMFDFYIAKGDVILFLETHNFDVYGNEWIRYDMHKPKFDDALACYRKALELSPNDETCKMRIKMLKKTKGCSSWTADHQWGEDKPGAYFGMGYSDYNSRQWGGGWPYYANGWGYTRFKDYETYFGQHKASNNYRHGVWNGLGLHLCPMGKSFYVEMGTWKNDKLVDGYKITDGIAQRIKE